MSWMNQALVYIVGNLNRLLSQNDITLTLDNIQQYLLPKYRANVGAHRTDSAIAIGVQISNALDSAIHSAKQNDAAELATMYDTQQKEAEIAQQKERLTHQRLIYTGVALVLVMGFFFIYTLHKRQATQRLQSAHEKLKQAYDQLEETTAAKERIESELRIARDIQKSMAQSNYGFEGICLSKDLDKLAGLDIVTETPSLFKISVNVMKKNSLIR